MFEMEKRKMNAKKKVLIISSSLRPDSNSHALCEEVAKGVEAAGGAAELVRLRGKKIGFCMGCYTCQKLHHGIQKDDANDICRAMCEADAVVFGTPVYYFTIAAQLKAVLDRSVQFWPEPKGKPYYVVATMAENASFDNVLAAVQGYMDCFDGARIAGSVLATEVYEQGAVKSTKFMQEAFDLGKSIVAEVSK